MAQEKVNIKATPFFKISKKPGRNFRVIDLRKQFGFLPDRIVIERLTSANNVVRINAILTEEEEKKRKALEVKVTGKE